MKLPLRYKQQTCQVPPVSGARKTADSDPHPENIFLGPVEFPTQLMRQLCVGRIQKKVEEKLPVERKEKPLVERGSGSKKVEEKWPVESQEKPLVDRGSGSPTMERKRLKKEISEVFPTFLGLQRTRVPCPKRRRKEQRRLWLVGSGPSWTGALLVCQRQQGGEKPLAEALRIKKRPAAQISKRAKKRRVSRQSAKTKRRRSRCLGRSWRRPQPRRSHGVPTSVGPMLLEQKGP